MSCCPGLVAAETVSKLDISVLDRDGLDAAMLLVKRVDGWVGSVKVAVARRGEQLRHDGGGQRPDTVLGEVLGKTETARVIRRAATLDRAPTFDQALTAGEIGPAHVDAFGAAIKLNPNVSACEAGLLADAKRLSPDRFNEECQRTALLLSDDGADIERRQRKQTRLRRWRDRHTGMYHLNGVFDPLRGAELFSVLDAERRSQHHEQQSGRPVETGSGVSASEHADAVGLHRLVCRGANPNPRPDERHDGERPDRERTDNDRTDDDRHDGDRTDDDRTDDVDVRAGGDVEAGDGVGGGGERESDDGRVGDEPVERRRSGGRDDPWAADGLPVVLNVHIDLQTLLHGLHQHSIIELNSGGTLSVASIRRLACAAAIIPIVMNSDGVVLDVGRSQRLATSTQRRALRAMYPACAHPNCSVRFEDCTIHHLTPFEPFGLTNLNNLLPLCSHHHHDTHEGAWRYSLDPRNRTLTIHRPDGTLHSTNPPPRKQPA